MLLNNISTDEFIHLKLLVVGRAMSHNPNSNQLVIWGDMTNDEKLLYQTQLAQIRAVNQHTKQVQTRFTQFDIPSEIVDRNISTGISGILTHSDLASKKPGRSNNYVSTENQLLSTQGKI